MRYYCLQFVPKFIFRKKFKFRCLCIFFSVFIDPDAFYAEDQPNYEHQVCWRTLHPRERSTSVSFRGSVSLDLRSSPYRVLNQQFVVRSFIVD